MLTGLATEVDLAIAGGGLAATLTAAMIRQSCPELSMAIIDRGGTRPAHTWSFHAKDLSSRALNFVQPLISKSWTSYLVRFPDNLRKLPLQYCSIRSEHFWGEIDSYLPGVKKISGDIKALNNNSVVLADGTTIRASAVLDARGIAHNDQLPACGWQKFVGLEIESVVPHGIVEPTVMDATIRQVDGFRFFYVLPFSSTSILIEDTYYSDDPALNCENIEAEIHSYIRSLGIEHYSVISRESGALPIPLDDSYLLSEPEIPAIGMRAGFFHPTSGYSLPYALKCAERLAEGLCNRKNASIAQVVQQVTTAFRKEHAPSSTFLISLNRMLFRAAEPAQRWKIFTQFYRRKLPVITQFYSGSLSFSTKIAMICGVPPVPIFRGLKHFFGRRLEMPVIRKAISG